jgi:hypothetical protein
VVEVVEAVELWQLLAPLELSPYTRDDVPSVTIPIFEFLKAYPFVEVAPLVAGR